MLKDIDVKLATINDLRATELVGERLFDYPIKIDRAKEFLGDPRHHLVLAFHKRDIVGMASGFHYVHPDKDPTLFVNEVSVLDGYQTMGLDVLW